ncbi:hypothetical protein BDN71DRAFT_1512344 [Pleurotus eryngii]|uniref:Lysine-specific metallo-endopeptidase domain-containing protein n=1 Tax=Pleurotus eryngii TaxID=5323 RepID=A0A9P5ZMA1_PLEER|nr:hypothetical protein BDN71DRAFT_1512344 [Pleurotus eryngii]
MPCQIHTDAATRGKMNQSLMLPSPAVAHEDTAAVSSASAKTDAPNAVVKPERLHDCKPDRVPSILKAIDDAKVMVAEAFHYLNVTLGEHQDPHNPHPRRYITWFGAFTQGRYTRVYTMFKAIHLYYDLSLWDYYCNPIIGKCGIIEQFMLYAFCDAKGYSKASTLIHEASHFDKKVWGGTDMDQLLLEIMGNNNEVPWEKEHYGAKDRLDLAAKDPDCAVHNADNYNHFVEYPNGCPNVKDGKCTIS